MNFGSGLELKKVRTLVSKCLILKNKGVGGNTARVCIKTVSSVTMIFSACFIGPGYKPGPAYFDLFTHLSVCLFFMRPEIYNLQKI